MIWAMSILSHLAMLWLGAGIGFLIAAVMCAAGKPE